MPEPLIPVSSARAQVLAQTRALAPEPVPVGIALGRVLAQDVTAATDLPPFENSAMDGFAVHQGPSNRTLRIVGESRAGAPATVGLNPGEAIRISTGAPLPAGADAVVRVEDTDEADGHVTLTAAVQSGRNVRRAGEDLRRGEVVLRTGTRLGAAELAVAIGAGAGTLSCARRPRVAVLCTGDELIDPGAPLGPGQIHNSNATMLAALALQAGAEIVVATQVPDDRDATEASFASALEEADVVVASGGVSVGPHDHVKPALERLGVEQRFWRVSLQPGKPTWFGTRRDRLVLGLPGNPVSSFVTFVLFARPALLALQGAEPLPARGDARLAAAVPRRDREQVMRVRLEQRDGLLHATPNGSQGSHVTSSLVGADALAFVPPGEGELAVGERIEIEPL